MSFPDNWDETRRRFAAWWRGELEGSCILQVTAPAGEGPRHEVLEDRVELARHWTDVDYIVDRNERRVASTYYAGDAFPVVSPFLGPVIHTAFLGCELCFVDARSGWQKPLIDNWEDAPELAYDADNRWWKLMREITGALAEAGRDRFVVGITDMGGPGDDIAHLRGTENALMDFLENPDRLDATLETMFPLWCRYYDELDAIVSDAGQDGSSQSFGLWAPSRSYTMQSDFSCMVSERMFDRHLAPWIEKQARHLDYPVYHVDGPEAIRHIPTLCGIEAIRAVNWIPGDGNGPMTKWTGLVNEILASGKPVQIDCAASEVETILRECPPRGLAIRASCPSPEEADELVKSARLWAEKYDRPSASIGGCF